MINYVCREITYVIIRSSLHCDLMNSHLEITLQVEAAARLFQNRMMASIEHRSRVAFSLFTCTFPHACIAPQSTSNVLLHSGTSEMEAVPKNTRAFCINKINFLFYSDYKIAIIRYGSFALGGQSKLLSFLHKFDYLRTRLSL